MKSLRLVAAILVAFGTLFFATPAHAATFDEAYAALVAGQQEVDAATAARDAAQAARNVAAEEYAIAASNYDVAHAAKLATAVEHPAVTTVGPVTNVVINGTFDSTQGWTNVVASNTPYTGGAYPIIYNGTLKGSYTSGIYIQQTGTFATPTRQVTFSVDVWNYDTNEGNRVNNPDYYRIEFRTYDAAGNRLNYYNLEYNQWHNSWITRGATYTLSADAVRWDIGFRMADGGFWAGAFGPVMDNVKLLTSSTTTVPAYTTYGESETAAEIAAKTVLDAKTSALSAAELVLAQAQQRLTSALDAIPALQAAVDAAPPMLHAPTNVSAVLTDSGVVVSWDAPTATNATVERYSIAWSTTNFQSNGWGWNHDQLTVTIPLDVIASTDGRGKNYQFAIRADNNTAQVYSEYSQSVELYIPIVLVPPTPGDYSAVEGGTIELVAPEGKKLSTVTAWYGSPTDVTCGADVSAQVSSLINGATSAVVNSDNSLGDTCGGVVKVLILRDVTYTDIPVVVPTPEPTVEPTPTPSPTVTEPPIQTPTPDPVPVPQPTPEPSPSPAPSPEPEPTPVVTPPVVEPPVVIPTPEPTPTPEPVPTPTPEPVIPTPEPSVEPTPEPQPTVDPTPQPTVEPSPDPVTPVVPPVVEPDPPVVKPVAPEPPVVAPEPTIPPSEDVSNIATVDLKAIDPQELTDKQVEQLVSAAEEVLATADEGSPQYEKALEALAVAAQADDAELDPALAAIPLLGDVAGAALEVFNNLGNLGADMSPAHRETAKKEVVAAIVLTQVTTAAIGAATSAATATASSSGSAARRREGK